MRIGVVQAFLLFGACFSERQSPTDADPGGLCQIPVRSDVVGSVQAVVAIREFEFVPKTLRVPAGTVVTWVNCEEAFANEPHTSTHRGGAWGSEDLSPTEIYSRRFDDPGVFDYFCEPHPFMTATVIVE